MSKERLEEMERMKLHAIEHDDIAMLKIIEQAERVQELENDKEYIHELIDKTAKRLENLIEQNERYREVIDKLNNPPEEHEYTAEAYAHYVVSVLKSLEGK